MRGEQFDHNRSLYLDFYRGIAALGVATCHYWAFDHSEHAEFGAILFVEMFFPLSGFILGPQVLKVVRESRNFPTFIVRRWMRTLPLYFLGLAGVAVLTHNFGVAEFWKYFTFIKFVNGQYADNNFYSIAWSLAVEEYYYILFPLVLMLPGDRVKEKTIAFLAIGLIVKIAMTSSESHSFIRIATFARIDAIAIGFLAYLLMEEIKVKHLLVAIAPCIAGVVAHYIFRNQLSVIFFVYSTNILFGIVCALIYKWESIHPSSSELFQSVAKLIGQLSYSVYVLHIIMIELTHSFGFAVYITVTLVVSAVIYSNFEKPILLMRPKYGRF